MILLFDDNYYHYQMPIIFVMKNVTESSLVEDF